MVMKISALWDMIACSPLKVNGLYGVISQNIELFDISIVDISK
jgi:hypothetical protein